MPPHPYSGSSSDRSPTVVITNASRAREAATYSSERSRCRAERASSSERFFREQVYLAEGEQDLFPLGTNCEVEATEQNLRHGVHSGRGGESGHRFVVI